MLRQFLCQMNFGFDEINKTHWPLLNTGTLMKFYFGQRLGFA